MIWNLLADAADETPKGSNVGTIIIMVVLVVAIIGLFVWQSISGKKKQKEAQNMLNSIKVGDRIKTIGGVCGYLVEINDAENTIVIETGSDAEGNKSYIKFDKGAIYQTAPANAAAPAEPVPAKEETEAKETKEETSDKTADETVAEVKAEEKPEEKTETADKKKKSKKNREEF